jgi:hypothetical protein
MYNICMTSGNTAIAEGTIPTKSRRLTTSVKILKRFVAEHGMERLRRGTRVSGFHLGHWVTVRRTEHRRGTLPKWLENELAAIPGWTWDPVASRYREYLDLLKDFSSSRGLERLTSKTVFRGKQIGIWATCRRVDHRKGNLPQWIEQELESIPGWAWDPVHRRQLRNIRLLRRYVETHGWKGFTTRTIVDGVNIGGWVNGRRTDYRKGVLPEWLQQQLENIPGWRWRVRGAQENS